MIYLSPFFFPLYLLRFQVLGIPFTALEVFVYVLFGVWLIGWISRESGWVWSRRHVFYYGAAALLLFGSILGYVAAPDFIDLPSGERLDAGRTALGVIKGWIFAPLLYFFALTQIIRKSDQAERLLRYFVYSAALVALVGYAYALFDHGLTGDLRLSGFFESANYLSLYLVPALLLSVHFLFRRHGYPILADYLNTASLAVMAHALFMTQSYAAILGVTGALLLYGLFALFRQPRNRRYLKSAFLIALPLGLLLVAAISQTPKFKQFLDFEGRSSTSVRLEVYEISLKLIGNHPVFGVGPGLYQAYYQTEGRDELGHVPMEWNIPHPHNLFLAFWLNAGLLGFLALILLLILVHVRFTYPLIALWGVVIHGLFDTPFWKNDLAMIFWLLIASILFFQDFSSPKKGEAALRL